MANQPGPYQDEKVITSIGNTLRIREELGSFSNAVFLWF